MKDLSRHVPVALLLILVLKGLVTGFTFVDSSVLLVLAGLVSFFELQVQDKKFVQLSNQIKALEQKVGKYSEDTEIVKSQFAGIKINTALRGNSLR